MFVNILESATASRRRVESDTKKPTRLLLLAGIEKQVKHVSA